MKRRAFTLLELLVVIALIAILAAILFPVFAQVRERARQVSCMSNLSQLSMALHLYAQDYEGSFPPEAHWVEALQEYAKNTHIWLCPSASFSEGRTTYGYEPGHHATDPGTERLAYDAAVGSQDIMFRHIGRANVLFLNGKIKSISKAQWLEAGWPLPPPLKPSIITPPGLLSPPPLDPSIPQEGGEER